jgi:hypothetical protein
MRKIAYLFVSALLVSSSIVYAQGEMDAYKLSESGLSGTARYLGMGGAFGALGGDATVMTANPAGLSIYRSSEVVTTLSLNMINANTNWNGSTYDANRTKFNFDNIAYVAYFPTGSDNGIKGWNIGVAYNRLKTFNRTFKMSGRQTYSMGDYIADIAQLRGLNANDLKYAEGYEPYDNAGLPWLPILGMDGGFYTNFLNSNTEYHSEFGEWRGNTWYNFNPDNSYLEMREKGAVDQYNFSFSTNISDRVFLGATLSVTDINYKLSSNYEEAFGNTDYLLLENGLSTEGSGYAVNIGAIVRPLNFLRLGVAYNSPTWYKMTDYFHGYAKTYNSLYNEPEKLGTTPEYSFYDYKLRTSDKWILSAACIFGQGALLSVDYELVNYKNMYLSDRDDRGFADNDHIQEDFGTARNLKVGAEVKVTPQLAVRAGAAWQTSPVKSNLMDGTVEVLTAGTIPHYTIDKGVSSYSIGLGYRFTPNCYADLAYVLRTHKEEAYAFSKTFDGEKTIIDSTPAALKTNTTRVAFTLGFKF